MAASVTSLAADDADLLTEVPTYLKRLARMVVRGFYTTPQILVVDALVRDLCVREEDLAELLMMDKKMLRQALLILRRDRLIKSISRTVKIDDGAEKKFDYYFINFKSFVNVLKYKLDHMRKKIEADEKIAKNRQFYKCPRCGKEYGDLDINILFDPFDRILKCTYCKGEVEEDKSLSEATQSTLSVAELNQQTEPLLDLIRQCENVKLAPAVLEPEPKPVRQLVDRRSQSGREKGDPWRSGANISLYDNSAAIQITLNEGDEQQKVVAAKEQPTWLAKSTVHVDDDANPSPKSAASPADPASHKAQTTSGSGKKANQILPDLLIHESRAGSSAAPSVKAVKRTAAQRDDEDSSADEEEVAKRQARALANRAHLLDASAAGSSSVSSSSKNSPNNDVELMDDADEDDTEEDPSVKIGGQSYPVSEVMENEALRARMTEEELNEYQRICHQLYADQYDF